MFSVNVPTELRPHDLLGRGIKVDEVVSQAASRGRQRQLLSQDFHWDFDRYQILLLPLRQAKAAHNDFRARTMNCVNEDQEETLTERAEVFSLRVFRLETKKQPVKAVFPSERLPPFLFAVQRL